MATPLPTNEADAALQAAIAIIRECFPDREPWSVHSDAFVVAARMAKERSKLATKIREVRQRVEALGTFYEA